MAALKLASKQGTPTIVLIRDPIDAVASSVLRSEALSTKKRKEIFREEADMRLRQCRILRDLFLYRSFYAFVSRRITNYHIVDLEGITKKPDSFLALLETILGAERGGYDTSQLTMKALNATRKYGKDMGESVLAVAAPNPEKDEHLQNIKLAIAGSSEQYLWQCQQLYERVSSFSEI